MANAVYVTEQEPSQIPKEEVGKNPVETAGETERALEKGENLRVAIVWFGSYHIPLTLKMALLSELETKLLEGSAKKMCKAASNGAVISEVWIDEVPEWCNKHATLTESLYNLASHPVEEAVAYESTVQEEAGYGRGSFQSMNPNLRKLNPHGKSFFGGTKRRK